MINEELLNKEIKKQKKDMSIVFNEYKKNFNMNDISWFLLDKIKKKNKEICLVVAGFKCQNTNCRSEGDLQYHHLITRKNREYMDLMRYFSIRHYWGNIIILCSSCHFKCHHDMDIPIDYKPLNISKEFINKIKDKYSK